MRAVSAPNYSAVLTRQSGFEVAVLADAAAGAEARIVPALGNMAYEFRLNGVNLLWFPFESLEAFAARPALCGVPFLAPWANRIQGASYWVNGSEYHLNADLGNLRRDGNGKAIHGLLNFSPLWQVVEASAGDDSARLVSRLEFWRHPALMAQFPFAHAIEMTYRLKKGELEVETRVENLSAAALPVALGFHPYFQIHDAPRNAWRAHVAAASRMELDSQLIPTGQVTPARLADPHLLSEAPLDDVFCDLIREPGGRAVFWVEGARQRITVAYGPRYEVAVAYAPPGADFICFEPMAAPTNAFNLAHAGHWRALQSIPAGQRWQESFWISGSGF